MGLMQARMRRPGEWATHGRDRRIWRGQDHFSCDDWLPRTEFIAFDCRLYSNQWGLQCAPGHWWHM